MEETDPLLLSALQLWAYCPRKHVLIHPGQAFESNVRMHAGKRHGQVRLSAPRPAPLLLARHAVAVAVHLDAGTVVEEPGGLGAGRHL